MPRTSRAAVTTMAAPVAIMISPVAAPSAGGAKDCAWAADRQGGQQGGGHGGHERAAGSGHGGPPRVGVCHHHIP